jgi:hypothetical protein
VICSLLSLEKIDDIWARLTFDDGQAWEVSRRQVGPIGIGEALAMAQAEGLDLPSPAMIDAIWQCADLKIAPRPRSFVRWTAAEMNDPAAHAAQLAYVESQIVDRDFVLLVGAFKDVVRGNDGKIGLYGWHQLDGRPIQPYFTGHGMDWRDYSQGLRLVKVVR